MSERPTWGRLSGYLHPAVRRTGDIACGIRRSMIDCARLVPLEAPRRLVSKFSGRRFLWPSALIIVGALLVGLYALIREPADIGGGLILLAGYVVGGVGIVLLGVQVSRRSR